MARIVLIDDDDAIRAMLTQTIERLGHEVYPAANGKGGLQRVAEHAPNIVITDMIMPEVDGAETIIALHRSYPNIKIIAISGGGRGNSSNYLKMAKQLGAHVLLPKPFSREELKAAIGQLLA